MVQRVEVGAKKLQILGPVVSIVAILVIQDRLETLAIPNEWFRVEATLIVVASLRQRRVLLLTPFVVVLSDSFSSSPTVSVAKHFFMGESQF
jgi:hypothetical protein